MRILCCAVFIFYLGFVLITKSVSGQTTEQAKQPEEPSDQIGNYDENQPYCFRFTWVGPEFDNTSTVNTTCADYLDDTRARLAGVPCRQPLVVTYDGTPPNIDYLWQYHKEKVLCRQARGMVCAKYSYSFNNELQNVTYMCTKIFAKGEGAITSGCYKQVVNEYDVELCACQSGTGPYKPCNAAPNHNAPAGLLIMFSILYANRYLIT